ncbi:MAG: hypothetical protein WCK82_08110 [Bacteroidota bacterium]
MEDYKLLKERYLDNFKSESTNLKVLSICKVVLEHENSDSDYWMFLTNKFQHVIPHYPLSKVGVLTNPSQIFHPTIL